jgi:hypothetical protein
MLKVFLALKNPASNTQNSSFPHRPESYYRKESVLQVQSIHCFAKLYFSQLPSFVPFQNIATAGFTLLGSM